MPSSNPPPNHPPGQGPSPSPIQPPPHRRPRPPNTNQQQPQPQRPPPQPSRQSSSLPAPPPETTPPLNTTCACKRLIETCTQCGEPYITDIPCPTAIRRGGTAGAILCVDGNKAVVTEEKDMEQKDGVGTTTITTKKWECKRCRGMRQSAMRKVKEWLAGGKEHEGRDWEDGEGSAWC